MFYVYMLASERNGTLYAGSTDDLIARIHQHRTHERPGFTDKYDVTQLVWYELHGSRDSAFARERRIKEWKRGWKLKLVEEMNPQWRDLYLDLF